jgi:hypothetical protein
MRSTNPIWRLASVFWSTGFVERENDAGNSRKRRSREEVPGLVDEFEAGALREGAVLPKAESGAEHASATPAHQAVGNW